VDISIIVCTYDRLDGLKRVLESFAKMKIPPRLNWEVVIVDNNSPHNIHQIVENFKYEKKISIIYVKESKQGKCYAMNTGVQTATGEIIAFTDDDNLVSPDWIATIWSEFCDDGLVCVGGKILPIWAKDPPQWLNNKLYNCITLLDLSPTKTQLYEPLLYGCNMAIKKDILLKYGLFNVNKGPVPGKTWGGEEVEMISAILNGGGTVVYCPDMLVYHYIPESRMEKSYFRKWKFNSGEFSALHFCKNDNKNLFNIPLYIYKNFIKSLINFIKKIVTPPFEGFFEQLNVIYYIGFIICRLKLKK
jgi:glycosyltransferase involved in cell wall biosynthesis